MLSIYKANLMNMSLPSVTKIFVFKLIYISHLIYFLLLATILIAVVSFIIADKNIENRDEHAPIRNVHLKLFDQNEVIGVQAMTEHLNLVKFKQDGLLRLQLIDFKAELVGYFTQKQTLTYLKISQSIKSLGLMLLVLTLFMLVLLNFKLPILRNESLVRFNSVLIIVILLSHFIINEYTSFSLWFNPNSINLKPITYRSLISHAAILLVGFLATYRYFKVVRKFFYLKENSTKSSLITYASQSGTAAEIAKQLAHKIAHQCELLSLAELTPDKLATYQQVLVVASTYGQGQAPESCHSFFNKLKLSKTNLHTTAFSILALGDKAYKDFCQFGHQLNDVFINKGAKQLMPLVEVDRVHVDTIQSWWKNITTVLNWSTEQYSKDWQVGKVYKNQPLNPSSTQRLACRITLTTNITHYQAGDLLEYLPENQMEDVIKYLIKNKLKRNFLVSFQGKKMRLFEALINCELQHIETKSPQLLIDRLKPIAPRVYSIASLPNSTTVELLVRRHVREDGTFGLASGHLSRMTSGEKLKIRLRSHQHFKPPPLEVPVIMLCAGTGLAPFISFLKHRSQKSNGLSWLVFGEQNPQQDNYFNDDLLTLKKQRTLNIFDTAWSKCPNKPMYVADVLTEKKIELNQWVDNGAYIYLCGSASRIGESVTQTLAQVLGKKWELVQNQKRFFSDLY